jgi:hypothetical protein
MSKRPASPSGDDEHAAKKVVVGLDGEGGGGGPLKVYEPKELVDAVLSTPEGWEVHLHRHTVWTAQAKTLMVMLDPATNPSGKVLLAAGTFQTKEEMILFFDHLYSMLLHTLTSQQLFRLAHLCNYFGAEKRLKCTLDALRLGVTLLTPLQYYELGFLYSRPDWPSVEHFFRISARLYRESGTEPPAYAAPAILTYTTRELTKYHTAYRKMYATVEAYFDSFKGEVECDEEDCKKACAKVQGEDGHPELNHENYDGDQYSKDAHEVLCALLDERVNDRT